MSNFDTFFEYLTTTYPAVSNDRKNTYGDIWERKVCIWYLKNDPFWKTQFKPESIMSPEDWGYGIESASTNQIIDKDLFGIDLVAEDYDGRFWGIQAKCYTNQIPSSDIKSFITGLMLTWKNSKDPSKTIQFDKGLLLITDEISGTMKTELQNLNKEVVINGSERFDATDLNLNWFDSLNEKETTVTHTIKKPRPHQTIALKNITEGWENNTKGKVIMACGTGKTLLGLWASEELKSQNTLVLLPSLSLVNQIASEWLQNCNTSISPLFVCSDKTVSRGADQYISDISELGFPVTTDENEIVAFFNNAKSKHRVIFSTYQSSESIEKAQQLGAPSFDIIVADEAHHCAGKIDSNFGRILDESAIQSTKRLFMTATPKYVTKRLKREAEDYKDDFELASMDDETLFGPYFHTLNFGDAIADGLLTDYQVVINITTDVEVGNMINKRTLVNLDGIESDAESIGMMCSFIKAIEEYDLTHIITYHSRVEQAKRLSQDLKKIFSLTNKIYENSPPSINHVEGKMPTKLRTSILKTFREAISGIHIISNARCLTEGVDVRAVDGIAFFEPKRSKIDILQAVGRAIRKNDVEKVGTIFVPVFIPQDELEDPELLIEKSRFKDVWDILVALRDHDQILAEEIDGLRVELGKRGNISGRLPSKIIINAPTNIDSSFFDKITTQLVINSSSNWEEYMGALEDYKDKNNGKRVIKNTKHNGYEISSFVRQMRTKMKKGLLSNYQIERLDAAGISWNPFFEDYLIYFSGYRQRKEKYPNKRITNAEVYKNVNIGVWQSNIRTKRKQNKLSESIINELNEIGFEWDSKYFVDKDSYFNTGFEIYKKRTSDKPETDIYKYEIYEDFKLGHWVSYIRKNKELLSKAQYQLLNKLSFIWDPIDQYFQEGLKLFKKTKKQNKDQLFKSPKNFEGFNLDNWASSQKHKYRKKILSPYQHKLLDEAGFVFEITKGITWEESFEAFKNYKKINPDKIIPKYFRIKIKGITHDLGMWASKQRTHKRKWTLSKERIHLLENASIVWNPKEKYSQDRWKQNFNIFAECLKENPNIIQTARLKYKEYSVGKFILQQRNANKNGSLSKEQIKLLENAGINWG